LSSRSAALADIKMASRCWEAHKHLRDFDGPAIAGDLASLTRAAPYREPRKYEAGDPSNDDANDGRRHEPDTNNQAVLPPARESYCL